MSQPLHLTLVRHAPAAPRPDEVPPDEAARLDASRALTRAGRRKFRGVVAALRRAGLRFDRLAHSPHRRAAETAEMLMPLVDGAARAEPLLAAPPSERLLARLSGERLVLVGHQPWLGELAAWLAFGDRAQAAALSWRKGGVVLLEGEARPRGMQLLAVLPPGLLRRLDGG